MAFFITQWWVLPVVMEEQYLSDGNPQDGRNPGARGRDSSTQGRAIEGELPRLLGWLFLGSSPGDAAVVVCR